MAACLTRHALKFTSSGAAKKERAPSPLVSRRLVCLNSMTALLQSFTPERHHDDRSTHLHSADGTRQERRFCSKTFALHALHLCRVQCRQHHGPYLSASTSESRDASNDIIGRRHTQLPTPSILLGLDSSPVFAVSRGRSSPALGDGGYSTLGIQYHGSFTESRTPNTAHRTAQTERRAMSSADDDDTDSQRAPCEVCVIATERRTPNPAHAQVRPGSFARPTLSARI